MLEVLLTMIKGMMNPRKGRFLCVFFSVGLHFVCFRVCIVHFLFLIIELFGFVLISLELCYHVPGRLGVWETRVLHIDEY